MSDNNDSRPTPLGIYDRPIQSRVTGIEIAAVVLSVVWLAGAGLYFLGRGGADDGTEQALSGGFLLKMLVLFLPVAMIWVAATAARASRVMREESRRLQAAIDAIRHAYVAQNQSKGAQNDKTVAAKLEEIAEAQKKTETALAVFTTTRERNAPLRETGQPPHETRGHDEQAALPLGTPADEIAGPPLSREDFIRALNFPETTEDEAGFAALRKALRDREAAHLIRASQDILTLLSQDGIYMDDLRPDMARAEIWRRFAAGERGRAVAGLGGIRDRSSLALAAGRMKQDPIFRDAAHHFLRRFDKMLAEFVKTASDSDISNLASTRTARAFMLLGRVAGMFD